jgi:hypothetical protein
LCSSPASPCSSNDFEIGSCLKDPTQETLPVWISQNGGTGAFHCSWQRRCRCRFAVLFSIGTSRGSQSPASPSVEFCYGCILELVLTQMAQFCFGT